MKKSLIALAMLAAAGMAFAGNQVPAQRGAFVLHVQGDPGTSCDGGMAPGKPAKKAPGKKPPAKKCINASVPLDDGYMLAKGSKAKKPKKAKAPKTT